MAERDGRAWETLLLDSALDCIIIINHRGHVIEWNVAATRTFGWRRDEVLGRDLAELIIPPGLRARHRQGLAHYLETRVSRILGRHLEMVAVRRDGSELPVELSVTELEGTSPPVFVAFLRDVTERASWERALLAGEHRLRAILGAVDGMVLELDENGKRLDVWTRDPTYLTEDGPGEGFRDRVARVHQTGKAESFEYQHVVEGRRLWFDAELSRVSLDGAGPTLVLVARNVTERKRGQQLLARYELVQKGVRDAILVIGLDGRILDVNDAAVTTYYRSREAMLGLNLRDLRASKTEPDTERFARMGDRGLFFETKHRRADGTTFACEISARSAVIDGQQLSVCIVRDVSERHRSQQELNLLQTIVLAMARTQDPMSAMTSAVRLTCEAIGWPFGQAWQLAEGGESLRAVEAWYAVGPREANFHVRCGDPRVPLTEGTLGAVWTELASRWRSGASDTPCPRAEAAAAAGLTTMLAVPVRGDDGPVAVLEFLHTELLDPDDRLIDLVNTVAAEVGAALVRRRAEEEQARLQVQLRKSASEWRATFDAVRSPLALLSGDGVVRRLNRAARDMIDIPYRAIIGKPLAELARGPAWHKVLELLPALGEHEPSIVARVYDVDAGHTWDVVLDLIPGSHVEEDGVIALLRDVTQQAELERSLHRSQTLSAMGSLVAGVAHEVRNPLFGISATLEAFKARFTQRIGTEYKPYMDVLHENVTRLSELMRDLLDYGRPRELVLAPVAMEEVIAQAIEVCAAHAATAKVKMVARAGADVPLLAMDRARVVQILANIVENAIHHAPAGSEVEIATEADGEGGAWCQVRDHGPGFREDDTRRVFEPFFSRRRGGTGLGLPIVQRLVEQHGWAVSIANHPDGGAVVTVHARRE